MWNQCHHCTDGEANRNSTLVVVVVVHADDSVNVVPTKSTLIKSSPLCIRAFVQRWRSPLFVRSGSPQRRGNGTIRIPRAPRHGTETAQASHRQPLHRGVSGVGRGFSERRRRRIERGANVSVAWRPGDHPDAWPAVRLHCQTSGE